MAEVWFRFHHGTVNDPKWRVVASRASKAMSRKVTIGHVLAVWTAMMENASQAQPRGQLSNWSHEDVGAALDIPDEEVAAIHAAMQGKTLDGDKLTGWNRRQINREDPTAAERQRRKRERDACHDSNDDDRDIDSCHAMSRNVTTDKKRREEKREKQKHPLPPDGGDSADAEPGGDYRSPPIPYEAILAAFRQALPQLEQPQKVTSKRRRAIRKAWDYLKPEHRVAGAFKAIFAECAEDPFYNGTGPYRDENANWRPTFDFIIREDQFAKIYDRAMTRREQQRAQGGAVQAVAA